MSERVVCDSKEHSTQFIIGDMLRRNYKIFQDYYENYYEYYEAGKVNCTCQSQAPLLKKKISYHNLVYLWKNIWFLYITFATSDV